MNVNLDFLNTALRSSLNLIEWRLRLPKALVAPLLGLIWVTVNLLLAWRGVETGHLYRYFIAAGLINGGAIAVLVVQLASDRFQAVVLGAIGGISVDNIASQQTLAQRAIKVFSDAIHGIVHSIISGVGSSESDLENAITRAVWATVFVVLASLIGGWIVRAISPETGGDDTASGPT